MRKAIVIGNQRVHHMFKIGQNVKLVKKHDISNAWLCKRLFMGFIPYGFPQYIMMEDLRIVN